MAGGPGSPTNSESASICGDGLRSAEGFMARVGLLCILFAFLIVLPAWALDTSINDVVSNPASLDGKVISLNGKVVGLQGRVSAKGNAYYTFELSDGTRSVRIFSFGKQAPVVNAVRDIAAGGHAVLDCLYAERPGREYHNRGHVRDLLARLDAFGSGRKGQTPFNLILAELAIWFHDAIYEAGVAGCEAA